MLNRTSIMGRLVRDPELRRTGAGVAVTSFRVAVDRDFAKDGEREADFIDCVAWRGTAEFVAKHFTKGQMIVVDGRLESRTWTDKEEKRHYAVEVAAENVYFGEPKRGDAQPAESVPEPNEDYNILDGDDAQLPFEASN